MWSELRRRSVFRVAAIYVVTAWVIMQVVAVSAPALGLPGWVDSFVLLLLAVGLPVALVIAWAFELTPEGVKRTAPTAEGARARPFAWTDLALVAALVAVLGVSLFQALRPAAAPGGRAVAADDLSIAVLPFADMSPLGDQAYFSDGLSEELLNELAQIPELRVIARTSSFTFRGEDVDARTIGETLQVAHLLEGSVRKDGDDLRVTAQLIDASDGSHVWSQTYDRRLDGVFALQEEIAGAVAEQLSETLGLVLVRPLDDIGIVGDAESSADVREFLPAPTNSTLTYAPVDVGGTDSFEAYDHYLRGRALADQTGLEQLDAAIGEFERAIEIDPNYALPWVGVAAVESALGILEPVRAENHRVAQRAALLRAEELAPENWQVRVSNAVSLMAERDWIGAERELAKAERSGPMSSPELAAAYGGFFNQVGRPRRSVALHGAGLEYDPLSMQTANLAAWTFELVGDLDRAISEFERGADLPGDSSLWSLHHWLALLEAGDARAVEDFLATAAFPSGPADDRVRAIAEVWDSPDAALAILRGAIDDPALAGPNRLGTLASLAAYYGDTELALEHLRAEFLTWDGSFTIQLWHPLLSEVRRTKGFKEIVRGVGLVDYWRASGEWGDFCRPLGEDDFECF